MISGDNELTILFQTVYWGTLMENEVKKANWCYISGSFQWQAKELLYHDRNEEILKVFSKVTTKVKIRKIILK